MSDKKMSLVPPVRDEKKFQEFIEEPEKKTRPAEPKQKPEPAPEAAPIQAESHKSGKKGALPWEASDVTPRIINTYTLRFKQPDKLKAEFIIQNSLEYRSFHDFCMKTILKQIDKELKKLGV